MSDRKDGGPAFPQKEPLTDDWQGMTLRQYAAIKLRVPNSGTVWLDDMIRESLRDELSAKAMAAMIGTSAEPWGRGCEDYVAKNAYAMADALLSEREGGGV